MKIGDKIKTFEVKGIVKGYAFNWSGGNKKRYITDFALLLSENGQERVLEITDKNKSLNDCKMWTPTFGGAKYIVWNQFQIIK